MGVLPTWPMNVYSRVCLMPTVARRGSWIPQNVVTHGQKPPYGCWE